MNFVAIQMISMTIIRLRLLLVLETTNGSAAVRTDTAHAIEMWCRVVQTWPT